MIRHFFRRFGVGFDVAAIACSSGISVPRSST
jgi:hypothetical protein